MALRLRRGTDAERLLITPLEGELIYATDTKLLWVGDGTTVGGILATSAGGGSYTLQGLTDTQVNNKSDGQVLTWSSGDNAWIPTTVSGVGLTSLNELTDVSAATPADGQVIQYDGVGTNTWQAVDLDLDSLSDVSTQNGINTRDMLVYDGFNFVPASLNDIIGQFPYQTINVNVNGNFDGDLKGSVFAEDSTVMVDAQNSILSNGTINLVDSAIEVPTGILKFGSENNPLDSIQVYSDSVDIIKSENDGTPNDLASVVVSGSRGTRTAPSSLQAGDYIGNYIMSAHDGVNYSPKVFILGQVDTATVDNDLPSKIVFGVSGADGNFNLDNSIDSYGHFGTSVMKYTAFADATARDAAITSPSAGMTCFVTDGDGAGNPQFQGYTGSGWVALN